MAILNRYKYIIVSVLMIISILSINVIQPKAELYDSINLIPNGSFESGLFGIKHDGSGSISTWTLNTVNPINGTQDGKLYIGTGASIRPLLILTPDIIIGHKYYFSFEYKVNSGKFNLHYRNDVLKIYGNDIIGSGKIIIYITGLEIDDLKLYFSTQDDTEIQIDNVFLIDLTNTFGAGNEPNLIDCNAIYTEYFEGLKRQDIKPHDVTENAHKTVIQMIVSTMLVPIDMLKTYKVGNQISLFDIFIGMIILVILTKTILKIGGRTSSDIR